MRFFLPVFLPLMLLNGCTCKVPVVAAEGSAQLSEPLSLDQRPLEVRLSKPRLASNKDVLIVYATGDGGWRGLDEELFKWIRAEDHPMAGFSSKDYLKNLAHFSVTTTPRHLTQDYEHIIDFAEDRLQLPRDTPIILVGLSRGAGLAVVAAGQGELKTHMAGVVAIALTKEEEHVVHYRTRRRSSQAGTPRREWVEIQTYEYLPRLAGFPVVVIQSTNDGYLPAHAARALFGPDTELRKLLAVRARNHRFSGGCATLYQDTKDSLAWVLEKLANHPTGVPAHQ